MAKLLRRLNEFDITLEEIVDEVTDGDALGPGALGEVGAHAGLQIHGQLERCVLAEELAALRVLEVVLALHRRHLGGLAALVLLTFMRRSLAGRDHAHECFLVTELLQRVATRKSAEVYWKSQIGFSLSVQIVGWIRSSDYESAAITI